MRNLEIKQVIRKEFLAKRNSLAEEKRIVYSKMITDVVCSLPEYQRTDILLIYASYQSEVITYGIMEDALKRGIKVYCPKVLGPGMMEFYEIHSLNDVVCGYKNIPEPVLATHPYENTDAKNTLMIMPLVAFDSSGSRLGYGGGFYDRYLQKYPQIKKIALAYECQSYEEKLPAEETDVKPDVILTENNIIKVNQVFANFK